jgi:hypothetical protein
MRWLPAASLWLSCSLFGCSTNHGDCSCNVDTATDRRALACGTSACIAGVLFVCVNQAEIVQRGTCTAPAPSDSNDMPAGPSSATPGTDTGCSDLQSYCTSSCQSPATTAADCQATAAAQDGDACRQWLVTSGALCRP